MASICRCINCFSNVLLYSHLIVYCLRIALYSWPVCKIPDLIDHSCYLYIYINIGPLFFFTFIFATVFSWWSIKSMTIDKILTDGTYDGNGIFRCLSDNGILPCIKVRRMQRLNWKLTTSSGIWLSYLREMICKDGRIR